MSFWQKTKQAWHGISDPIKTDRSIDVACIALWLCYALFGFFTITQNASVFTRAGSPEFYQTIWGGTVGLSALLAAVGGILSFYTVHTRYDLRIRNKRLERFGLFSMMGLMALYPILIAAYGGETGPRNDLFSLALSYVVIPFWRTKHLRARINQLYTVAEMWQHQRKGL